MSLEAAKMFTTRKSSPSAFKRDWWSISNSLTITQGPTTH